ncbi:hypothetical protein [Halioxenophilus sp. WMMB6]|uniref:hypothetical protein n=1 Tax=Halioxenophilus sp. WMMB6 TaxID=3073815 RepID=UPI00295EBA4B|nr:hypothetical protein [Halioxenophilus sp. WMMB6]
MPETFSRLLTVWPWLCGALLITITSLCWLKPTLVTASHSERYFTCTEGYELQLTDSAVRCYRPQQTTYRAANACPTLTGNTVLAIDYQGQHDLCLTGVDDEANEPPGCAAGFELEVRSGPDRCFQSNLASSIAPSEPATPNQPNTLKPNTLKPNTLKPNTLKPNNRIPDNPS